jgi:TolB-like protein
MKYVLPLIITLFFAGCTLPNFNQQNKVNEAKKPRQQTKNEKQKIIEKKNDKTFSTQYDAKQAHVYSNLNNTIVDIADQLFDTKFNKKDKTRVILTTFVDLDELDKTSTFGRLVSESMFNELHIRKFLVTDFRGQDAVSVSEDGEFHITRDVEKLKDKVDYVEYILVGTYVKFEDESLLINARIMDSISGNLLSTARVVYHPRDCSLFGICKKIEKEYNLYDGTFNGTGNSADARLQNQIMNMNARETSNFSIIPDDCKDATCDK